jgi:hypothetical protein
VEVAAEVVEAAELQPRLPHRRLMVMLLPQLPPLHAAQVVVAAVVHVVGIRPRRTLLPQLQPTVLWRRLFQLLHPPQGADVVAVVVLLRPLQWKSFRRLPKAVWLRRCRSHPAL